MINTAACAPEVAVVTVDSELTSGSAMDIKRRFLDRLGSAPAVCVDLSNVTTVDGGGIQLLIGMKEAADAENKPLMLVSASAVVSELLDILDLSRNFYGTSSLAAAAS